MKNIISSLLLVSLSSAAVTAQNIHDYSLKVGEFNQLKVQDNATVVYTANPDSIGYAWFKGEDRLADAFLFSNSNGTLKIEVKSKDSLPKDLPTIYVASTFLTSVESSSSGKVTAINPAPTVDFKVKLEGNGYIDVENIKATKVEAKLITGNGTITLSGKCNDAKFVMAGAGVIQADALEAIGVDCTGIISGTIGCNPEKTLKAKGLGTKIYYKGKPTIKKSGSVKIISLYNEDDTETVNQ